MRAPLLLLLPLLQICAALPAVTEIGAVASEVSECSEVAGVAILKKGGNAVDAVGLPRCAGTERVLMDLLDDCHGAVCWDNR
jgi:hypothetical protein